VAIACLILQGKTFPGENNEIGGTSGAGFAVNVPLAPIPLLWDMRSPLLPRVNAMTTAKNLANKNRKTRSQILPSQLRR
jgi:hypothetical protein